MAIKNNYTPTVPVSPGDVLALELQERRISQADFAKQLGMSRQNLNDYLKGKRAFTADFALKLEEALGIDAKSFTELQSEYELVTKRQAKCREEDLAGEQKEDALSKLLNLKELYKRLDIAHVSPLKRISTLSSLLGKPISEDDIRLQAGTFAFKKSETLGVDLRNFATWMLLARIEARKAKSSLTPTPETAASTLSEESKEIIPQERIKEILAKNGIGYAVVKKLDKTPVDGCSIWVDGHPVIIVSHRHNDLDKLLFTVLHELGHLSLHRGEDFFDIDEKYSMKEGKEREANEFAEEALIPKKEWEKILAVTPKAINVIAIRYAIAHKAKELGIRSRLALQRYAYQTGMYTVLSGPTPKIIPRGS